MKQYAYVLVAVLLCSVVYAWAETSAPIVAVIPFEVAGISQDDADAFTARFAETLATSGTVSIADSHTVDTVLTQQGLTASDLIDAERATTFAAEAGANFLIIGKLFAIGNMAGAFVTIIGANPVTVSVAVRQAESVNTLMAEVSELCEELMGNVTDERE